MRIRGSPKANTKLSAFEMLYDWPFLALDLIFDTETHLAIEYIINLGQVQKALQEYGNKVLPAPKGNFQTIISPGDWVLLKTWKEGSPTDQLNPEWKGPCQVALSAPMSVKLLGVDSWVQCSQGKAPADPDLTPDQLETQSQDYTCESLEDFRFLFKRRKP